MENIIMLYNSKRITSTKYKYTQVTRIKLTISPEYLGYIEPAFTRMWTEQGS